MFHFIPNRQSGEINYIELFSKYWLSKKLTLLHFQCFKSCLLWHPVFLLLKQIKIWIKPTQSITEFYKGQHIYSSRHVIVATIDSIFNKKLIFMHRAKSVFLSRGRRENCIPVLRPSLLISNAGQKYLFGNFGGSTMRNKVMSFFTDACRKNYLPDALRNYFHKGKPGSSRTCLARDSFSTLVRSIY